MYASKKTKITCCSELRKWSRKTPFSGGVSCWHLPERVPRNLEPSKYFSYCKKEKSHSNSIRFFVNLKSELSRKLCKNPKKSRFCCVFMKFRCVIRPSLRTTLRREHLWERSLREPYGFTGALVWVNRAFGSVKKAGARRRDHASFGKSPEFRRALRRKKSCTRPACDAQIV